jgi:hypothetical protein
MRVVEWEENETESGIKLAGTTKITRRGEIISSHAFPAQDGRGGTAFMVAFVVRRCDTGDVIVINGLGSKVIDVRDSMEQLSK